jgi:glutamate synthase (NADPH/NADH) small chain
VEWGAPDATGRPQMNKIAGSEFEVDTELVLLAMGFLCPDPKNIISQLGVRVDTRGNIQTDADGLTSVPGVFAAGDARRGQSLVVWAIAEGRHAAYNVDRYLAGTTSLRPVITL